MTTYEVCSVAKRRLIIAVDCDDVLVPTAAAIINDYNHRFNTSLELSDFYSVDANIRWGTTDRDVVMKRVSEFLHSEEHAEVRPFPDAVTAIAELAKVHELHLVTGRAGFLDQMTKHTIDTYFPGCFQSIEHTNFIVASDSGLQTRSKGEVCAQLGADVLIDDHIVHGESVLEAGVQRVIVFGSYPWNQGDIPASGMVRCVDWSSVVQEINQIAAN